MNLRNRKTNLSIYLISKEDLHANMPSTREGEKKKYFLFVCKNFFTI